MIRVVPISIKLNNTSRCVILNMLPFVILFLTLYSHPAQTYKAAVVHYNPWDGANGTDTILKNLNHYHQYVAAAKKNDSDIIIFPEYGLVTTSALSNPTDYAIALDDPIVEKISTMARKFEIYLVVNLFEKGAKDAEYYNTNLVFDRNGTLVLKYHKMHLYNEGMLTAGSPKQKAVFTTDFNVTFAIFTCFDILFHNPAQSVLQNTDVTDVIFATGWIPSYIAPSVQHGYAYSNGVNLLASNYAMDFVAESGTGVFFANGTIAKMVESGFQSTILIQEVPKVNREKTTLNIESKSEVFKTKDKFTVYHLDLTKKKTAVRLCNHNFCCNFDIVLDKKENKSSDSYILAAFDGFVHYNYLQSSFRLCSLLACRGGVCGLRVNTEAEFKKISVTGEFPKDGFYRPLTLKSSVSSWGEKSVSLVKKIKYSETAAGNSSLVQITCKKAKNILAFGVFAREDSVSEDFGNSENFSDFSLLSFGQFWKNPFLWNQPVVCPAECNS